MTDCTRFEAIGLHLGTAGVLLMPQAQAESRSLDLQGGLRLSLTALEILEVGAAASGRLLHSTNVSAATQSQPLQLMVRMRLLPLPAIPLSQPRLSLTYQHDLVLPHFGLGVATSSGLVRLVASEMLGPVELSGSVGVALTKPDGAPLEPQQLELGASASWWLRQRPASTEPGSELRLQAEALYRFPVGAAQAREGSVLLGLMGLTSTGYGGGIAVGAQLQDRLPGLLVLLRLQTSWGAAHDNPWATRKAGEPKTTPAWIWKLLGAIDPLVGPDGCVWTDPDPPHWPSERWFCIGTPTTDDPKQILLPGGKRVAVGTHVWEIGQSLRLDDGSHLAQIPWSSRILRAIRHRWWRNNSFGPDEQAEHRRQFCEGQVGVLAGAGDLGTAQMVANDTHGSQSALVTEEVMRAILCSDMALGPSDPRVLAEATSNLGSLSMLGRRGPLRAKPSLPARLLSEVAPSGTVKGSGGGAPKYGVADHAQLPVSSPQTLRRRLDAGERTHLFSGQVTKLKDHEHATGWHFEATGDKSKETYVIESSRSARDEHGVYSANVVVLGVKKKARSTFFPQDWTEQQVEAAIAEAFENKQKIDTSVNAYCHGPAPLIALGPGELIR